MDKLEDDKILASIKRDGKYNNAAFFSGVAQMTAGYVFSEPAWITILTERDKP